MKLEVIKLDRNAIIPTRGSKEASGLDLYSLEDVSLSPGEKKLIKTGIAFNIPSGYEIQIRPRSGMSFKTFFNIANSPGTIDADYQGECCIIGHNIGDKVLEINKGYKIAQAVLCPVVICDVEEIYGFPNRTDRGEDGFGSTGV
jgi:dUTP pyrophosphatase